MSGHRVLKALREKVEIDNCGLFDEEVEAIIDKALKEIDKEEL